MDTGNIAGLIAQIEQNYKTLNRLKAEIESLTRQLKGNGHTGENTEQVF